MEHLKDYVYLANFAITMLVIPAWKLMSTLRETIRKQDLEMVELKKMNKTMAHELKLLKIVVFKFLPAEATQEYMKGHEDFHVA